MVRYPFLFLSMFFFNYSFALAGRGLLFVLVGGAGSSGDGGIVDIGNGSCHGYAVSFENPTVVYNVRKSGKDYLRRRVDEDERKTPTKVPNGAESRDRLVAMTIMVRLSDRVSFSIGSFT